MTITAADLPPILASHAKWMHSEDGGVCADLRCADLRGAYLRSVELGAANLRCANLRSVDLNGADLRDADLSGANLRSADLRSADLRWADLRCADLRGAYLSDADLSGANLRGADLRGVIGVSPELTTPLLMLLDQPGMIRAYKLVNESGEGPFNGGIVYRIGEAAESISFNTDPNEQCAEGINVATLDWCICEWRPGYRILIVEFTADDIACIPTATDGKFRLKRCMVIAEKAIDPVALGLVRGVAW